MKKIIAIIVLIMNTRLVLATCTCITSNGNYVAGDMDENTCKQLCLVQTCAAQSCSGVSETPCGMKTKSLTCSGSGSTWVCNPNQCTYSTSSCTAIPNPTCGGGKYLTNSGTCSAACSDVGDGYYSADEATGRTACTIPAATEISLEDGSQLSLVTHVKSNSPRSAQGDCYIAAGTYKDSAGTFTASTACAYNNE